MDGYQGVLPCIWKKIRQYRFRDSYQQVNSGHYPRRRGRAVIKGTRMGRPSWGLKVPKLRICVVSPASLFRKFTDMYTRMMMKLTGKKDSSRLAYGSCTYHFTKSSSKRISPGSDDTSSVHLNYMLNEGSLSSASHYTKW